MLLEVFSERFLALAANAEFVFDESSGLTAAGVRDALAAGVPSIISGTGTGVDSLVLDPHTLEPGEEAIVAKRLRAILVGA